MRLNTDELNNCILILRMGVVKGKYYMITTRAVPCFRMDDHGNGLYWVNKV